MTSHWEGLSLALVEAMAAGLPVVVSDVPGLREVVTAESQAGFLVDPTDEKAIAERLQTLIDDPGLRRRMGENARRHATQFSVDTTIAAYLGLYDEVARHQSRSR